MIRKKLRVFTLSTPYLVEEGNEHYKEIQKLSIDFGMAQIGGSAATLLNGKIVKSGGAELAHELEEKGYDWIKAEN